MLNEIPAKAHMSDKSIIHEYLSREIKKIGPWAYSGCVNLHDIHMTADCDVSNTAFKGCENLTAICLYSGDDKSYVNHINISPYLLALSVRAWQKDTSSLILTASDNIAFIQEFDSRMLNYLKEPDNTGFVPFLAGGEEDYDDNEAAMLKYSESILKLKILMIYERILISRTASEDYSVPDDIYANYLIFLKKNNPDPVFTVLTEAKEHRTEFADLYFELGLNKEASNEELLKLASSDTSLRALILVNNPDSGQKLDTLNL